MDNKSIKNKLSPKGGKPVRGLANQNYHHQNTAFPLTG